MWIYKSVMIIKLVTSIWSVCSIMKFLIMFSQIFQHKSGHTKYGFALHKNETVLFSSITVCLCCCYVCVCHDFSCLTTEFRGTSLSQNSMLEKQGGKDPLLMCRHIWSPVLMCSPVVAASVIFWRYCQSQLRIHSCVWQFLCPALIHINLFV